MSDDIRDAIERMLREQGAEGRVHVVAVEEDDYIPTDDDEDNAATTLARALATLDNMADKGIELAVLLREHKRFMSQAFATLGALVIKQGGRVTLTREDLKETQSRTLQATWDDEDENLLVLVSAKEVSE